MGPVRVAYTLEQCWHRVPGGTAVAALAVAERLAARTDVVELVGVAARHRHPPPPAWAPPIQVHQLPLPRPALYDAWLYARTPPVELRTGDVDVIHSTTIVAPPRSRPLVVTVHDLAFLHDPEHFPRRGRRLFRRALEVVRRCADLVLVSSQCTADDCVAAGVAADRLRVVPLGVTVEEVSPEAVAAARRGYGLDRPYVLFVGTVEPRKNLRRLAAAVAALPGSWLLVVAGPSGWGDAGAPPGADARFLGFVGREDLRALYAGAAVFAFPSLREGFGLPVAEAMAQGVPVVTSKGTSTEEVAGGAAVLVDPTDVDDIAAGIEAALDDRDRLGAAGRARAAMLSWERSADGTFAAYRELTR
jgi:glycosyltransferase involved in cell wall biosynthesis